MANYLWKVTATKNCGELPAGASVEVVMKGTTAKPSIGHIREAVEAKYGISLFNGCPPSYFDYQKI